MLFCSLLKFHSYKILLKKNINHSIKFLLNCPMSKDVLKNEHSKSEKNKDQNTKMPNENFKNHKAVDPNKLDAIQQAMKQIKTTYGNGSIMFFGETTMDHNISAISTGSFQLNKALGIGGIPSGRVTEIYGNEGSGKTTIALHVAANCQKNGGICAFIDAEHALDLTYAKQIGINVDNLIISQPDSGEEAIEICEKLIRSGAIDLIVVDSVAALVSKQELEGDMEDSSMGSQARMMSKALKRMVSILSKNNTAIIFINQVRSKIGVIFGNPETTTGGYALRFYSSIRIEVKKKGLIKKKEEIVGQDIEATVRKNKFAPPMQKCEFQLIYGVGIDNISELVDICVEKEIISKNGTWFSMQDRKLGQGKEFVIKTIIEEPELYKQLLKLSGIKD